MSFPLESFTWILELEALRTDVFRFQTVLRLCRPLHHTALLTRQPCARQFFGNCPIRVDSRFCRAHPYMDKSRRRDSHSTLECRTELGHPFERHSPRSPSNTSEGMQLRACRLRGVYFLVGHFLPRELRTRHNMRRI